MSAPTPAQLADLMEDVQMTLGVLKQAAEHLQAAITVLNFHAGTDKPQHVTLKVKH